LSSTKAEVRYLPLRWLAAALGASHSFVGANWVPGWAEGNGCDPIPEAIPAPGPRDLGKTSKDIDATEELWAFFQRYRLEGQP